MNSKNLLLLALSYKKKREINKRTLEDITFQNAFTTFSVFVFCFLHFFFLPFSNKHCATKLWHCVYELFTQVMVGVQILWT